MLSTYLIKIQTGSQSDVLHTKNLMSTTDEIYTEAILFMLDSITPTERINIKNDLRLKLERSYELQPSTLAGLKALERILLASDFSRQLRG